MPEVILFKTFNLSFLRKYDCFLRGISAPGQYSPDWELVYKPRLTGLLAGMRWYGESQDIGIFRS